MRGLCGPCGGVRGTPNHRLGGAEGWLPSPGPSLQRVLLEFSDPWSLNHSPNPLHLGRSWEACQLLAPPPAEQLRQNTHPRAEGDLVCVLQKHKSQEISPAVRAGFLEEDPFELELKAGRKGSPEAGSSMREGTGMEKQQRSSRDRQGKRAPSPPPGCHA